MPTRNSMRGSGGRPALRSVRPFCTSIAQRTASTTLRNSTRLPSPVPVRESSLRPSSAEKEPQGADDLLSDDQRRRLAVKPGNWIALGPSAPRQLLLELAEHAVAGKDLLEARVRLAPLEDGGEELAIL